MQILIYNKKHSAIYTVLNQSETRQERSVRGCVLAKANLMSSSVTMKALHSGWAVLSHTPGFFSTAADSWPVMGAALVCRALAMADSRVLSVHPGPTPEWPTRQLEETPQKTVSCDSSRNFDLTFKKIKGLLKKNKPFILFEGYNWFYLEGLLAVPSSSPAPLRCHMRWVRWVSSPRRAGSKTRE